MGGDEVEIVRAWHQALNEGDVERLLALSHDDIEVGGPRGSGRGAQLLRQWFGRAGIRLTAQRMFHRGTTVVVEQRAGWRSSENDEVVASVFVVQDKRVASVIRHPDLASALETADLDEGDHV